MRNLAETSNYLHYACSQIAAKGDHHYFVYKEEKANRTETNVKLFDRKSGLRTCHHVKYQSTPFTSALANAWELLANHTN